MVPQFQVLGRQEAHRLIHGAIARMRVKPTRRFPVTISTILVCFCGLLLGCVCNEEFSSVHAFCYPQKPPPSGPHWEYEGLIEIWGARVETKARKVDIRMENLAKKNLLRDTLVVIGKKVNALVSWKEFERIHFFFYEGRILRDLDFASLTPDMILREVDYVFDKNTGRFQRSK